MTMHFSFPVDGPEQTRVTEPDSAAASTLGRSLSRRGRQTPVGQIPGCIGATLCALFISNAEAGILADLPDAIVCSVKDPTGGLPWEQLVFYVSAQTDDGRTLYKTLTSDPVVLFVNEDGRVDGGNLADCDGQSVATLAEKGQAFHLAQPSR